jgi:hypothetical protein
VALAGSVAGCDGDPPLVQPNEGPPLRVISTYPENGAGFECSITDLECGVPIDAAFEIRFDRYLLPATAARESFSLYTGEETNTVPRGSRVPGLTVRYDVVERVVTYSLPTNVFLQRNTHYTAELVVPADEGDVGFRAFDGAPLDEDTLVRVSFLTSNQRAEPAVERPVAGCSNVLETLGRSCTAGNCHGSNDQAMRMDLSDELGLSRTVIGRVAHQTETGPTTGVSQQNPARFGVGMPRIDPGRPDNSYLMYKLIAAPENYRASDDDSDRCSTSHRAAVDPATCVPASPEENERLAEWFLQGVAMPRADDGEGEPVFLVRDELLDIQSFIRAGAACP